MDGFSPAGVGDTAGGRPLVLRDSSKLDKGQAAELGVGNAGLVGIITGAKDDGTVTGTRDGMLQPRNWHESISESPVADGRSLKDRRYSVALVADHQNGFDGFSTEGGSGAGGTQDGGGGKAAASGASSSSSGVLFSGGEASLLDSGGHLDAKGNFISAGNSQAATDLGGLSFGGIGAGTALGQGASGGGSDGSLGKNGLGFGPSFAVGGGKGSGAPGNPSGRANVVPAKAHNPILDDWGAKQKSTRIIDYNDPKGRAALLAQLVRVVDDANQQYTAAIPFRRLSPSDKSNTDRIACGYLYDAKKKQSGLMDSVFAVNSKDKLGAGRESTPYGLLGVRTDAHFEWVPAASGTTDTGKGEAPDIDESNHGPMKFDATVDISSYTEGGDSSGGTGYKGTIYLDKSTTPNVWRPCIKFTAGGGGIPIGFYTLDGSLTLDGVFVGPPPYTSSGGAALLLDPHGTTGVYGSQRVLLCDTLTVNGAISLVLAAGGTKVYAKKLVGAGTLSARVQTYWNGAATGLTVFNASAGQGGLANGGAGKAPNAGSCFQVGKYDGSDPVFSPPITYGFGGQGGGGGGTSTAASATPPEYFSFPYWLQGVSAGQLMGFTALGGGSGGGGGAGANSGAGGMGGGMIQLFVEDMSGFTGVLDARGSDGADGATGVGSTNGGGGGGGGLIIVGTSTTTRTWTVLVSGGAGGAGKNGGANGASGNAGFYIGP